MNLYKNMSQPKQRKKRTPNKNWYFTAQTDESIKLYNSLDVEDSTRSRIYNSEIKPAFNKLVENIIHTFKFYYTDGQSLQDVQHEVVSFLVEKLPKFASSKGKAFSYFSIVAKNYLILNNNKNYKKLTDSQRIDYLGEDSHYNEVLVDEVEDNTLFEFIDSFVIYMDLGLEKCFPKKSDQVIASAVLELFRKRENLEIFNKKALYIYVREMTNANTQQITKVVKMLKTKYELIYNDYDKFGYIPADSVY